MATTKAKPSPRTPRKPTYPKFVLVRRYSGRSHDGCIDALGTEESCLEQASKSLQRYPNETYMLFELRKVVKAKEIPLEIEEIGVG